MRALATALCLMLATPAARGAAPVPDEVTRKKVQTYVDLAADLFKANDFEGALAELRRAEALSDLGLVRYNIARCLEELHRDTEAVAAFQSYLSLKDTAERAGERQTRARDAVVRLSARAFGTLEVSCPVAGSSVMVMKLMQVPEQCPWKSDQVSPGFYEIQTFSPGQPTFSTKVEVVAGKTVSVTSQAGPSPQTTRGDQPAPAPTDVPRRDEPAPSQPDRTAAAAVPQQVRPAQEPPTATERSPGAKARFVAGIVMTAVGIGALATTAVFMYEGKASTDRIKNGELDYATDIQSEADLGQRYNIAAIASGAIGLALTAGGVILLVTSSATTTSSTVQVGPTVFPSGGGLAVAGQLP